MCGKTEKLSHNIDTVSHNYKGKLSNEKHIFAEILAATMLRDYCSNMAFVDMLDSWLLLYSAVSSITDILRHILIVMSICTDFFMALKALALSVYRQLNKSFRWRRFSAPVSD